MRNRNFRNVILFIIGLAFLAIVGLIIKSGFLRHISSSQLNAMEEVPKYDILDAQNKMEQEIIKDYNNGTYTIRNPYIVQDPYKMNPLSALVIFETGRNSIIRLTVEGKDEFSTFHYSTSEYSTHHEIPVYGLYPGIENTLTLESVDIENKLETSTIKLITEALPTDFQTLEVRRSVPSKMESGVTLVIACLETTYSYLLDANGDVRGFLSHKTMAHGDSVLLLKNGHLLATGDELKQMPYNMTSIWEFNWLGKIYTEYEIPNGVHHGLFELPNGDILAVSNNRDMFQTGTREDVAIVIDRNSGTVKHSYDFRKILDEKRNPYTHFHPDIKNSPNIDWMHMNAAIYDVPDNSIIVSSPIQSAIIKIDAENEKINWILSSPEGWDGSSSGLNKYLLKPVGDNFTWSWGQHDPTLLPDNDNNPNTTELLVFDNGQNRSFTQANATSPQENYSRAVIYRINDRQKTVEQIWEYGKNRGGELYSSFLGDADLLPVTKNILIDFGGMLRLNGQPVDDIIAGVTGNVDINSSIIEVTHDGEVVFEVNSHTNNRTITAEAYQAERIPIYPQIEPTFLTKSQPKRIGTIQSTKPSTEINLPPFFIDSIAVRFDRLVQEGDNLLASGRFTYNGKPYLIGKGFIILVNNHAKYIFPATSGLNGLFFLRADLKGVEAGDYAIAFLGVVVDGNDAASKNQKIGFVLTENKIKIP